MADDTKRALIGRLIAEHGDRLLSFLARRLRRPSDAAELAQEVYMRMLRVPDLGKVENIQAYLFTVANNLIRETALRERHQRSSIDVDDPMIQGELVEMPAFGGQLDSEQRIKRMREVLAQLSPKCQAVVELKYWKDHSYEEIAQQLGISTNMVKKYLSQALVHCRRRMARLG